MSESDVRDVEALAAFAAALQTLGHNWDQSLQEVKATTQRAREYFSQERRVYWIRQTQLAEHELSESKDVLAQKQAAARAGDRAPATEAAIRVRKAELRLRECEEKNRKVRSWALHIAKAGDELLGPLADVSEHAQVDLPVAARELQRLVTYLRQYADQSGTDPA